MSDDPPPPDSVPHRLDPDGWARVQEVFHAALERPVDEREAFVRSHPRLSDELVSRVLGMVANINRESILDRSVGRVAGEVLEAHPRGLASIGPYRVVRVLGQGGMGVVYLGEREDLGLRAAIKVLKDASLSPARRDRFMTEERLLAGLVHPNVARLYDANVLSDGTPYFVMEYVEGEPLDDHCRRRRLIVRDRLRLFSRVCDAVRFAHGRAIVHRDLKPSNIVVTPDGEPKLLDFGIAKHLDSVDRGTAQTRTGLRLMTPRYAAPEQLLGTPVGVYTDVYALGVVLYELLAGAPPYDLAELTPAQAERVVLAGDTEAPSLRAKTSVPHSDALPDAASLSRTHWKDLDVLCATAMHVEQERRYASVEALARDVDHFLAGEPLEARPDSLGYRTSKFARRHAAALGFATAGLVTLATTVGFYTWRVAVARDQALAEAERTRRVQAFTENLFAGGDVVAGPSDTLRVLTLLDRGVREAGLLSADPSQQSDMFGTLGTIYARVGRFDRADSLLTLAAALRDRLDPADPAGSARARVALGELRIQEGRYSEAETLLLEAWELQRRTRPVDELAVAGTLGSLGAALEGQGEYERASELLEQALETFEASSNASVELSATLAALAATQFYQGKLEASDSLNRRAMEIDRRLHGEGHPTVGDGLINLGAAELQRGHYAEAVELFQEAADIMEGYHGPDHPETASALRMLSDGLIFEGRLAEAEPLLERALVIQERSLNPEHPRLANTLGNLAYIRLRSGRFEEAVALYERIVTIYRTANGERHYFVAIGLSNLANALMEGGQLTESETMFRDVIERFTEARGASHLDTGIARIKLGRALLLQGRPADAEADLLAGYEIVKAEAAPTVSWLRSARADLAEVYDALSRPDRAEHFRREQEVVDSAGSGGDLE